MAASEYITYMNIDTFLRSYEKIINDIITQTVPTDINEIGYYISEINTFINKLRVFQPDIKQQDYIKKLNTFMTSLNALKNTIIKTTQYQYLMYQKDRNPANTNKQLSSYQHKHFYKLERDIQRLKYIDDKTILERNLSVLSIAYNNLKKTTWNDIDKLNKMKNEKNIFEQNINSKILVYNKLMNIERSINKREYYTNESMKLDYERLEKSYKLQSQIDDLKKIINSNIEQLEEMDKQIISHKKQIETLAYNIAQSGGKSNKFKKSNKSKKSKKIKIENN